MTNILHWLFWLVERYYRWKQEKINFNKISVAIQQSNISPCVCIVVLSDMFLNYMQINRSKNCVLCDRAIRICSCPVIHVNVSVGLCREGCYGQLRAADVHWGSDVHTSSSILSVDLNAKQADWLADSKQKRNITQKTCRGIKETASWTSLKDVTHIHLRAAQRSLV